MQTPVFSHEIPQLCINLSLPLRGVRFAIPINVFANFNVGHLSPLDGNGDVAQRTNWDLDILIKKQKDNKQSSE